jgi:DNA-binding Lrp family transcriptional regulator
MTASIHQKEEFDINDAKYLLKEAVEEDMVESDSAHENTSTSSGVQSRHILLQQLNALGVEVKAFESLSITELSDLLYGLNKAIALHKDSNRSMQGMSTKDKTLPTLSLADKKILKALILSEGHVSSLKLSRELDIPLSTVQRRRKRLEDLFIDATYHLRIEKFGWRRASLFISTQRGLTLSVAKELLSSRDSVLSVRRTMGASEIDLQAEFVFKRNAELIDEIEKIKTIDGVKSVTWNETIEVIGNNPNHFETIIDNY